MSVSADACPSCIMPSCLVHVNYTIMHYAIMPRARELYNLADQNVLMVIVDECVGRCLSIMHYAIMPGTRGATRILFDSLLNNASESHRICCMSPWLY